MSSSPKSPLERQVEERASEVERRAATEAELHEVLAVLNSNRPLQEILEVIVELAGHLIGSDAAFICRIDRREKRAVIQAGFRMPFDLEPFKSLPLLPTRGNRAMLKGRPVRVSDLPGYVEQEVLSDPEVAEKAGEWYRLLAASYQSMLGIPIVIKGEVYGTLGLYYRQARDFSDKNVRLGMSLGDHVALAIENARMRNQVERRAQVAEGLRDIVAILNSKRPVDEVLDYIVGKAARLLGTEAVSIYRLEVQDGILKVQTSQGLSKDFVAGMEIPVRGGVVGQTVMKGKPLVLPDLSAIMPNALKQMPDPEQQRLLKGLLAAYPAMLAVPLIVKGEVHGALALYYPHVRNFSDEEIGLALTLADQAALAIENARLLEMVEESAVAAERSRLAHDLHDAVTQTLFSASLIAEVLPVLWERDEAEGRRRLEELRELTRGALAEMRTLLLELRPAVLFEADLADLLRQLAEATTGRSGIVVTVTVDSCRKLPDDVKVGFYRIAQEALNNVARHSEATNAEVTVSRRGNLLELLVKDNGRGFEPGGRSPDSLGLGIMAERAREIGASSKLRSKPGRGTEVSVRWEETDRG